MRCVLILEGNRTWQDVYLVHLESEFSKTQTAPHDDATSLGEARLKAGDFRSFMNLIFLHPPPFSSCTYEAFIDLLRSIYFEPTSLIHHVPCTAERFR